MSLRTNGGNSLVAALAVHGAGEWELVQMSARLVRLEDGRQALDYDSAAECLPGRICVGGPIVAGKYIAHSHCPGSDYGQCIAMLVEQEDGHGLKAYLSGADGSWVRITPSPWMVDHSLSRLLELHTDCIFQLLPAGEMPRAGQTGVGMLEEGSAGQAKHDIPRGAC